MLKLGVGVAGILIGLFVTSTIDARKRSRPVPSICSSVNRSCAGRYLTKFLAAVVRSY